MSAAQSRNQTDRLSEPPAAGTLPPWGTSLAILFAAVALGIGAFILLLKLREPMAGWIVLGLTVAGAYAGYVYLPGIRERRRLWNARDEGKRLLKAVARAAKKQRDWTGSGTKEKIEALQAQLREAIQGVGADRIESATAALDELADKTFVRKPMWREYSEQIGAALLAALILRAFFYEAYKIPSGSMLPTLDIGDHLFVNKFVYGFRIPFTVTKIWAKVPKRGDIVVFDRPGDVGGDALIKRVIGLPGDTIEVTNDRVRVNGVPLETEDIGPVHISEDGEAKGDTDYPTYKAYRFKEKAGDHTHISYQFAEGPLSIPNQHKQGKWTVEPGKVFVMGDNRDNSQDSRFVPEPGCLGCNPAAPECSACPPEERGYFGQVPIDYIKGRADIIWLSLGGPNGVRFDRFFNRLE